ncbi:tetratricopeptide repeat protein, partial [bacterium]|nr:tetratricopeptide repeat protein [bacterium]
MKKKLFIFSILLTGIFILNSNVCFSEDIEITESDLNRAVTEYKRGVDMINMKAYDTAISHFQQALKYNPNMTDAYYNIAAVYVAQEKYDEAYNIYVKIIALNPYDYDAILQAAKISYNRKNYALTMKYLKYIPDDYVHYGTVKQLYADAKEQFDSQRNKIERSKVTVANKNKRVLIDKFNSPAGMVVDSEGNIFVASYSDNAIIKVDRNKNKTNYVKDYLLDGPVGLAIDAFDNIYIANFEADNILKVTKSGNVSVFMDNVSKP